MGLIFAADIVKSNGFPLFVQEEFPVMSANGLMETQVITQTVDYTFAIQAFVETFLRVATDLVPVDTGKLLSSIKANAVGNHVTAIADTNYAQYVEFGTYKMSAQPYFIPALEEALDIFFEMAGEAMDTAYELMYAVAEDVFAVGYALGAGTPNMAEGGLGTFGMGLLGGLLSLLLAWPLIALGYGIMETLFGGGGNSDSRPGLGGMSVEDFVDIT